MSPDVRSRSPVAPLATLVRRVVDDVIGTVLGHLELLGMEAREAATALAQVAVMAGLAVLFLASTWFMMIAAGIIGLLAVGAHPVIALVVPALATLIIGVVLAALIRSRLTSLHFPATLRQLRLAVDSQPSP